VKVGFVSDAHGNPHGLKVCLEHLRRLGVKDVYFLGDAVGYFPDAQRTIDLLEAECVACLMGNHEAMLLGDLPVEPGHDRVAKITETREQIGSSYLEKIRSWERFKKIELDGRDILCVHGNPWDPLNGYVYPDSDIQGFSEMPFDAFFLGHTHRPFIRKVGASIVTNVGSCSLPRDQGNLASCSVYDSTEDTVQVLRVPFDKDKIIRLYGNWVSSEVRDTLLRQADKETTGDIVEKLP